MLPTFHRLLPHAVLAATLLTLAAPARAAGWNEAVDGDFSNNGLAPTVVALNLGGSTTIWGTTGRAVAGGPVDTDYFSINVPAGQVLSALNLLPGTAVLGDGSFLGLMAGSTFTVPPTTASAAGLLGWTLFGPNDIGGDLLGTMSSPLFGSSGFTLPLPAGNYSFWVQETAVGTSTYGFSLVLTAVPEPASALSMLGGLVLLGAVLKRR